MRWWPCSTAGCSSSSSTLIGQLAVVRASQAWAPATSASGKRPAAPFKAAAAPPLEQGPFPRRNTYQQHNNAHSMHATSQPNTRADSTAPTWANVLEGQANVRDALLRTISFDAPNGGKQYRLKPADELATLLVRCAVWPGRALGGLREEGGEGAAEKARVPAMMGGSRRRRRATTVAQQPRTEQPSLSTTHKTHSYNTRAQNTNYCPANCVHHRTPHTGRAAGTWTRRTFSSTASAAARRSSTLDSSCSTRRGERGGGGGERRRGGWGGGRGRDDEGVKGGGREGETKRGMGCALSRARRERGGLRKWASAFARFGCVRSVRARRAQTARARAAAHRAAAARPPPHTHGTRHTAHDNDKRTAPPSPPARAPTSTFQRWSRTSRRGSGTTRSTSRR